MPAVRGTAIRKAYEAMGLDRREFADLTNIPPRTLTNIVNGATTSNARVARIAQALRWDPEDVLESTVQSMSGAA